MTRDDVTREELLDDCRAGALPTDVERRGVVAGLVASAAAALGLGGVAGATPADEREGRREAPLRSKRRAERRFGSVEDAMAALSDHDDAFATLAEAGYLDATSAAELTLDPAGDRRADGHERVTAVERPDGSLTPEIRVTRLTDGGSMTVGVRPDTGERWAAFGAFDATEPVPLDDVTTLTCCRCCGMEQFCCGDWSCGIVPDGCYCSEWCWRCTGC